MSMPMVGSRTDSGAGDQAPPAAPDRAPARLLRRVGWSTIAISVACGLMVALGFLWFIWRLPADELALNRDADGIVVLTGGASRISAAMELLAAGHGRRLLISGAHRPTTRGKTSRLHPAFARWVRCSVVVHRSL